MVINLANDNFSIFKNNINNDETIPKVINLNKMRIG